MPKLLAITPNFTIDHLLHVDHFIPGEVHRTAQSRRVPGGKGVNVARIAREFGQDVELAGFLGGFNGQFAQRQFEGENFIGHYVWFEGETRNSILIDELDGRTTVINEAGHPLTVNYVQKLGQTIQAIHDQFDWISISGSIPPGVVPETYAELIDAARPTRIAVDSNGAALGVFAHHKPDLLRINGNEAAQLMGRPIITTEDAAFACKTLHSWQISLVVISMGEKGAVGFDGKRLIHAVPPSVTVVSTVGAGDAMFGAMLAALMSKESFDVAMRQGTATGAACCTVQATGFLPYENYMKILSQTNLNLLR